MARRGRSGSAPEMAREDVQAGIEELAGLAAREGAPDVPDNLGNFNPEPRPVGRRQPTRLPTVREEQAADEARRHLAPTAEGEGEEAPSVEVPAVEEPSGPAVEELPTDEGEPEEAPPAAGTMAEMQARLDEWERRDLERSAQLDRLMASMRGAPGPMAGGPPASGMPGTPAGDPRVAAAAASLRPENLVPWRIDEGAAQALGMTPQGAQLMQTMFQSFGQRLIESLLNVYGLDQEMRENQRLASVSADQQLQAVNQAFYAAHPNLGNWGDLVDAVSAGLAERYPALRQNPAEWIRHTATETYRRLEERGVRIARPAAPAARGAGLGAVRPTFAGPGARIRPAAADFGGGRGGVAGNARLTPLQKEMLDLARSA